MANNAISAGRLLIFGGLFFALFFTFPLHAQEEAPGDDRGGPGNRQGGNGPGEGDRQGDRPPRNSNDDLENAQENLQALITQRELIAASSQALDLPSINDAKAQLGKQLFFAKNLGGEQSVACASCHHPMLGGGDNLSLSVGVDAVNELAQSSHNLLGLGRFNSNTVNNLPSVARNAPTIFNLGFNDRGLFWDSRVETRRNGVIVTPDSPTNEQGRRLNDPNLPENTTLAAAQARFPLTSPEEMRGGFFPDSDNQTLRAALTARFNNSDNDFPSSWPSTFTQAFGSDEVTFDKIAEAIGEYERSMIFIDNPWQEYLDGNDDALTAEQKVGAILFFGGQREGGVGCSGCHRGPTFSSNRHQLVAYPQFGPGKGNDNGSTTNNDYGRENISNNAEDRFHFRAPTLLNIAVTAPYGHTGAYQTLEEVISHYNDPEAAINRLFSAQDGIAFTDDDAPFCQLPQIQGLMQKNNQHCQNLYPNAYANSMAVVEHLQQARDEEVEARAPLRARRNLSPEQISHLAAFLNALTDPCVIDRECLNPWIINEIDKDNFPDPLPLVAHDKNDNNL